VAELEAKLAYVSIQMGEINGLKGPHVIIEGCNVHVQSGSGDTNDSAGLTGRGNLIIGYNEPPLTVVNGRLGSHNLWLEENMSIQVTADSSRVFTMPSLDPARA
jgi:hypothetical protein